MAPQLEGKEPKAPSTTAPARGLERDSSDTTRRDRLRAGLVSLPYHEQVSLLSPRTSRDGLASDASATTVSAGSQGLEFLLAWNSNADLTKVLAFSTPGITAFGVALLAEKVQGAGDHLKGYPNLTPEQWRWIRETGHPFAIGNYWEQNSQGKPLVFVNIYGHGTLGILNMMVADALFPNSPVLALVAATIMYTNFELFGEGSVRARYEPNDFFISNIIPMIGSQAVADLLNLEERLSPSVVASAQSLVYALCSGSKMSKTDWLSLAAYPVLWRLVELSPVFRGRSRLLDEAFEHLATTFGSSEGIGPYTGVAYRGQVGEGTLSAGVGFGPGGQRASVSSMSERVSATVYGERAYRGPDGQPDYRVGASVSMTLGGGTTPKDLEVAKRALVQDVKGYLGAMKGRANEPRTLKALEEAEKELLAAARRCKDASLANEVRSGVFQAATTFLRGEAKADGVLAWLRTLAQKVP